MKVFLTSLLLILVLASQAQITGQVNTYTAVSNVDNANATVSVSSNAGFAVGDLVLLMQMQGLQIDESNTASFGNLNDANGVGGFELQRICDVSGNDIAFENQLVNIYNPNAVSNAAIQLIRVPEYIDVDVGAVTVPNWNGSTGGVLVISASGTINLVNNISLDGQGFRGASSVSLASSCNFFSDFNAYFYNTPNFRGNLKGEGLAVSIAGKEGGRGRQFSGGGGANDHNAGGGGGSNYGLGGIGGTFQNTSLFGCPGFYPGLGGLSTSTIGYSVANKAAFMGGGGGAGHADNGDTPPGGNGGGIVILLADVVEGNNFQISVNGQTPANAGGDGGSGGGAGGSILLSVNSFGASTLNLQANGGNGGGAAYITTNCQGPGGGGGGGAIWSSTPFTANVNTQVTGGSKGINRPSNGCPTNSGVADGAVGAAIDIPALSVPIGSVSSTTCVLPVEWLSFEASILDNGYQFDWQLAGAMPDGKVSLLQSLDAQSFHPVQSFSAGVDQYLLPISLRQTTYFQMRYDGPDGEQSYSDMLQLSPSEERFFLQLSPNPAHKGLNSTLEISVPRSGEVDLLITNPLGQHLYAKTLTYASGERSKQLVLPVLPAGTYFVSVFYEGERKVLRWLRE
ncbi:MAG: T9SS type A sorting domain-containing protein [Bacteroidota bacterium]